MIRVPLHSNEFLVVNVFIFEMRYDALNAVCITCGQYHIACLTNRLKS